MSARLLAMGVRKYLKNFEYAEHENEAELPLRWKEPRRIFVNSMSDMFHEEATVGFIGKCFHTMLRADWHTYQVLTKRPLLMARFSKLFKNLYGFDIPPHIWMGTSVEGNMAADRIRHLLDVRCHVRFVSFEPLLEEIDSRTDLRGIDWAIIGGESGPGHRPIKQAWVDGLISQCKRDDVRVFFKQWGGARPKSGGRLVHGKKFDEYPRQPAVPGGGMKLSESAKDGAARITLPRYRLPMAKLQA